MEKNDVLAGKNAGCKTALIGDEDYGQDMSVSSLSEFVNKFGRLGKKEKNNGTEITEVY